MRKIVLHSALCLAAVAALSAHSACRKKSSSKKGGGVTDAIENAGAYSFKSTPSAIALTIPASMTQKKSGSGLNLNPEQGGGGSGAPSTSTSVGYYELTEKTRRVQGQLASLTLNNAVLDTIMSSKCDLNASTVCEIQNACGKVSDSILKAIEDDVGEERLAGGGELAGLQKKSGTDVCFQNLKVTKLDEASTGFAFKAEMKIDADNMVVQSWTSDKNKVRVENTFKEDFNDFGDPGAAPGLEGGQSAPVFKGTSVFNFNAVEKVFSAQNKFNMSFGSQNQEGEEVFLLKSVAGKNPNDDKVILSVNIKDSNGFALDIEGEADNNGGFVRTGVGFSRYEVSNAVLDGNCEQGKQYNIYPAGTPDSLSGFDVFAKQIGGFSCNTAASTLDAGSVNLMSKVPAPVSGLVLFTMEGFGGGAGGPGGPGGDPGQQPGGPGQPPMLNSGSFALQNDPFSPTVTKSNLKFTTLDSTLSLTEFCYEESFNAKGEIKGFKAANGKYQGASTVWTTESGVISGDYNQAPPDISQGVKVKVVKTDDSAFSLRTFMDDFKATSDVLPVFQIVSNSGTCSSKTSFDNLATVQECLLGIAVPESEKAENPSEDFSEYSFLFTGSESQLPARMFVEKFGTWTPVDGAKIVKN